MDVLMEHDLNAAGVLIAVVAVAPAFRATIQARASHGYLALTQGRHRCAEG
jgi:hypothetical protein